MAAVSSNAMAVVLMLVVGVAWVAWVVRRLRGDGGPMIELSTKVGLIGLAVFAVFGIARNLPFGSWFMP